MNQQKEYKTRCLRLGVLSAFLAMIAAACVIGWLFTDNLRLYSRSLENVLESYYKDVVNRYSILAVVSDDYGETELSGTNFRYGVIKGYKLEEVEDRLDDESLYSYMNFDDGIPAEESRFVHSYTRNAYTSWRIPEGIQTGRIYYYSHEIPDAEALDQEKYVIVSTYQDPFESGSQDLFSRGTAAYEFLYAIRYVYFPVLALCLAGMAFCLYRILRYAGPEDRRISDRIPLDIFAVFLLVTAFAFFAAELMLWHLDSIFPSLFTGMLLATVGWVLFLLFACSIKACVQKHTGLQSLLLGRIGLKVSSMLGKKMSLSRERRKDERDPADTWKRVYGVLGLLCLAELAGMVMNHTSRAFFIIWLLIKILLFIIVWRFMKGLVTIKEGAAEMAIGNLNAPIPAKGLPADLAQLAEDLNSLGKSFDSAVEERMKSERFQMELITNVSHDIKTPITSIINYTDLLKKEDLPGGKVREYVDVLERQSFRLKRLLQDLIDASRASSGAVEMHPEKVDMRVFLIQLLGEYRERMEEKKIDLHTALPEGEDPLYITADSRHLFRVFDNLLLNVCKYAQPGTRAYLDLTQGDTETAVTIKNISAAPLNIPSEELMQRFVQGDRSRNSEGSGLGLSIAGSLTSLMGGKLDLVIDGDLFKAVVSFPQGKTW